MERAPQINRRWFNSLLLRMTLFSLTGVVLLGIPSSIFLYNEIQKTLISALERRTKTLSVELSISSADLFTHHDYASIQKVVEHIGRLDSVEDILVFDPQGNILARKVQVGSTPHPMAEDPWDGPTWESILPVIRDGKFLDWHGENTYRIATPVNKPDPTSSGKPEVVGVIYLSMNTDSIIGERRDQLIRQGLFNLASLILMAGLVAPVVYFSVIKPLNRVRGAAQKITEGSFDALLPVSGFYEIASLSDSFNRMAARLQTNQTELKNHMEEMTILNEIGILTSQTLNLDDMLAALANHMARLVNGTGAFITLWDETRKVPVPRAAYGSFLAQYKAMEVWPDEPTLTAKVLETGVPIVVADTLNTPFISYRIASQFPEKSILGLPLIVNNRPIGAVLIGDTRQQRSFTLDEIQMAMTAAGHVAVAINNAQLFASLASERNHLKDILDAVSDPILVLDHDYRIRSSNRSFSEVIGFDLGAGIQPTLWEMLSIPVDQLACIKAEVTAAAAQGIIWRREMVVRQADGNTFDADLAVSAIRDVNKEQSGYVVSLRDISVLKELDRMKTRFVSTVSHELRTPLSVITLHTENLLEFYDRLSDKKRQDLLRDIHTETINLHQLIEDLLNLSRLDSGRAEPRRTYFSLGDLVSETSAGFHLTAAEKNIALDTGVPNDLLSVFADRDQLRQVFRNLISNALKFTPPGGRVWLEFTQQDGQVQVKVSDTGIGIPASDMPRVFERFYRSELSVQQEIPGTGLGLAISREILSRHQGTIEVESAVGQGTCIRVGLPLSGTPRPVILLVDPIPSRLAHVNPVLAEDYQLVLAADLDTAWTQLLQSSPALVILGMSQLEATDCDFIRGIRVDERTSRVPILAMPMGGEERGDCAVSAGADAVMTLPIFPSELLEQVQRLLDRTAAPETRSAQPSVER